MSNQWLQTKSMQLRNAGHINSANTIDLALEEPDLLTKIVTVVDRTPTGASDGLSGRINIISITDQTP